MKKAIILAVLASISLLSCKSTEDKAREAAIDSTESYVSSWLLKSRNSLTTPEERKEFVEKFNELSKHNKAIGVVSENLTKEQTMRMNEAYRKAAEINKRFTVAELQDNFTRLGNNSIREESNMGKLILDFE